MDVFQLTVRKFRFTMDLQACNGMRAVDYASPFVVSDKPHRSSEEVNGSFEPLRACAALALAHERGQPGRQPELPEFSRLVDKEVRMKAYRRACAKANFLCEQAVDEACQIALEEGGITQVLELLAMLKHGETLPASMILRLEKQATDICKRRSAYEKALSA